MRVLLLHRKALLLVVVGLRLVWPLLLVVAGLVLLLGKLLRVLLLLVDGLLLLMLRDLQVLLVLRGYVLLVWCLLHGRLLRLLVRRQRRGEAGPEGALHEVLLLLLPRLHGPGHQQVVRVRAGVRHRRVPRRHGLGQLVEGVRASVSHRSLGGTPGPPL